MSRSDCSGLATNTMRVRGVSAARIAGDRDRDRARRLRSRSHRGPASQADTRRSACCEYTASSPGRRNACVASSRMSLEPLPSTIWSRSTRKRDRQRGLEREAVAVGVARDARRGVGNRLLRTFGLGPRGFSFEASLTMFSSARPIFASELLDGFARNVGRDAAHVFGRERGQLGGCRRRHCNARQEQRRRIRSEQLQKRRSLRAARLAQPRPAGRRDDLRDRQRTGTPTDRCARAAIRDGSC